jgi:hypothetical protein
MSDPILVLRISPIVVVVEGMVVFCFKVSAVC